MADNLTKAKRSWLMSRVRGSRTLPERQVEKLLRHLHITFRRHISTLPGTPDIVLPHRRIAIFVNGCFWHGHASCVLARLPSTRKKFWTEKIETNRRRDRRVQRALRRMGWKVVTVWGCRAKSEEYLNKRLKAVLMQTKSRRPS